MEDYHVNATPGAEQASPVPLTEGTVPHLDTMAEGSMTLHGLAQETGLGAVRQMRDVADYLGLSPTVVRGVHGTPVQSFSPEASEVLETFVMDQSGRGIGPVLGDSNS